MFMPLVKRQIRPSVAFVAEFDQLTRRIIVHMMHYHIGRGSLEDFLSLTIGHHLHTSPMSCHKLCIDLTLHTGFYCNIYMLLLCLSSTLPRRGLINLGYAHVLYPILIVILVTLLGLFAGLLLVNTHRYLHHSIHSNSTPTQLKCMGYFSLDQTQVNILISYYIL
ncbi:hypothetical protein F5890DRAFT_1524153, partial [Lentinula detonsa]